MKYGYHLQGKKPSATPEICKRNLSRMHQKKVMIFLSALQYREGGFCSSLKCPRPAGKQLEWVSASIVNIKSAFSQQKIGNLPVLFVFQMYFIVIIDKSKTFFYFNFFTVSWIFSHCELHEPGLIRLGRVNNLSRLLYTRLVCLKS